MNYYEEIQKELEENPQKKAEFEALEIQTFEEFWSKNQHLLKKPEQKTKRPPKFFIRLISIAAGIFVFLGVGLGLGLYFGLNSGGNPTEYRYEDSNITMRECYDSEISAINSLYLTDFNILSGKFYHVGLHDETHEVVYYTIGGVYDNGIQYRAIVLRIILNIKYNLTNENKYNTENREIIGGYSVSVFEDGLEDIFYQYKLGLKAGDIRYYIDYSTINENDYADFLAEFLK